MDVWCFDKIRISFVIRGNCSSTSHKEVGMPLLTDSSQE